MIKYTLNELYYLNKLAIVGAFSLLSDAIQVKTGTIFLSRTSGADISGKVSALYLGQTIIGITAYAIMQGITVGMCTLCSQAHGAYNHILVGTYFMRALLIASLSFFPLLSVWIGVTPVILYITGDIELAKGAGQYTTMFCFGYPAFIYYKLANGLLQSQNIVYSIMCIMVAGNVCNICLQYLLVVVIPLDIQGVGLAYIISTNIVAVLAFSYIKLTNIHILIFNGWSFEFLTGWCHMLKYGSACLAQLMLDVIIFRIAPIVFIGFILKDIQQFAMLGILNTIWCVTLAGSIGYGVGTSVRIGNLLGGGNLQAAKRTTIIAILYLVFFECCFGVLTFSLAEPLSNLFTSIEEMRVKIEFGIRILSICIVTDILTAIRSILTACSLQVYATLIQFVCNLLIATPLGLILSFYVQWRAVGYFLMPSAGSLVSALLEILILYLYDWRKIFDKVLQNANLGDASIKQKLLPKVDYPDKQVQYTVLKKSLLVLRYLLLIFIGIVIFVPVYTYTTLI